MIRTFAGTETAFVVGVYLPFLVSPRISDLGLETEKLYLVCWLWSDTVLDLVVMPFILDRFNKKIMTYLF